MKILLTLFTLAASAAISHGRPALIATGWDSPTPAQFRQHVGEFERWGIFDGTTIRGTRTVKGKVQKAEYAFSREIWKWSEFSDALADLRAAKPVACRETFLMVFANPGDVDWFDDDGWREIVNKWRLLARLAKQGGLRGLLFDAEPYQPPHAAFTYAAQSGRAEHSFAEYRAKARERGREVMQAVAEEYPEVTIFTYRLFSDMLPLLDSGDVPVALETASYGLLPAFVDGWMDAAPAGVTIVEGTEDIGYRANSPEAYNAAFTRERLRLPEFLAPENRECFGRQLRIGQSLYLDAHINPPGNPWTIDRSGSSPAGRLRANTASALAASDGIVWLYGEKARWWPGGEAGSRTWAEALPGAVRAIRLAKDPAGFARDFLAEKPARPNLLPNANFKETAGEVPGHWFLWQAEDSRGASVCAGGRVEIRGAVNAVLGVSVKAVPGTILAARLRVKSTGNGVPTLTIGWKTAKEEWTAHAQNAVFVATGAADADGWREIVGTVEVPRGAGKTLFMAGARGQLDQTDRCEFSAPILAVVPIDE